MGLLVLVLTATLAATGCNRPAPPGGGGGEGPGHRPQRLALTPEQEYSLGEQAYKEVLAKARAEGTLISAGPPVKRVARVGSRIAKVAEGNELLQKEINLHLRGYKFDWEFNVIRSKQINAFCLPGGKIAVYTGLLQLVGDNDNWLATVLGHEIAHALAHHSSERIARENMTRQAIRAAEGALGRLDPSQRKLLIGLLAGGAQIRGLAYDRQQESEADHIGVFLMTFAGYDPDAAITFWERMAEAARGRHPPAILSTHPSDAQRIKQLRAWVVKAKEAKEAYDEGRVVR
jgi:predicted Zn-dependent protease